LSGAFSLTCGAIGYKDKSKLKQLAERHVEELFDLGMTATVAVMPKCGGGAQVMV
jgi:hypothetical protein